MLYVIEFAVSVKSQLDALSASHRARVLDAIEKQLADEPLIETRNRKRLRPNPVAPWELRVGAIRVFYDVEEMDADSSGQEFQSKGTVYILAIGQKTGNVLRIGGIEVQL